MKRYLCYLAESSSFFVTLVNEEINFVGKDKQNHFAVTIDDYDFDATISLFSITKY